jgi:hypothetical protein
VAGMMSMGNDSCFYWFISQLGMEKRGKQKIFPDFQVDYYVHYEAFAFAWIRGVSGKQHHKFA